MERLAEVGTHRGSLIFSLFFVLETLKQVFENETFKLASFSVNAWKIRE